MSKTMTTSDAAVGFVLQTIEIPVSYEAFTKRFEQRLGRYNDASLKSSKTLEELERNVAAMRGNEAFSIYAIHDHGRLAELAGKYYKAKQYVIGNSRIATHMTVHKIRVSLYVPINFLIFEDTDGKTKIEYLTLASQLDQFDSPAVQTTASVVDEKRFEIIQSVVEDVQASQCVLKDLKDH